MSSAASIHWLMLAGLVVSSQQSVAFHVTVAGSATRDTQIVSNPGRAVTLSPLVQVAEYSCCRDDESVRKMMDATGAIACAARAVRQTGCGAMDLCYLARGSVDAVFGGEFLAVEREIAVSDHGPDHQPRGPHRRCLAFSLQFTQRKAVTRRSLQRSHLVALFLSHLVFLRGVRAIIFKDALYLYIDITLLIPTGVAGVWKPWDWAAGVLIAKEAGAVITSGEGSKFRLMGHTMLSAATAELGSCLVKQLSTS